MCGIVGIFNKDPQNLIDENLLARMNRIIAHRGPDDEGFYISGSIGLGHRRLSVIDLSAAGHQPMVDKERNRVIIYNGEVYNFLELRDQMAKAGMNFITNCDTEVILKSASFSNLEWMDKLNGMFAFAIWDESTKTVLFARDRLGIKPFYYVHLGDEFLFASEIKALLMHPKVRREINAEKLPEFFAFRTITGEETMFEGILELPPGYAMILSQENFQPRIMKFWGEGNENSLSDYVDLNHTFEDQFHELITQAVRYRLIADVPVGSYNSGGVDSSLNSSIMRSLTEGEMHTFSVGFEEASYDERKYAQIVADKLGTHHHALVINEPQYLNHLEKTLYHLEEPINHAHTVQLLLLSRYAKELVTVVLTGEGADEVFGGYPRLQIPVLSKYLHIMPRVMSRGLLNLSQKFNFRKITKLLENVWDVNRSIIENARWVPLEDFDLFYPHHSEFKDRKAVCDQSIEKNDTLIRQILYFDQRAYLPSLLNRLDKVSMASALECRVPFLDYKLVEWSFLIPDNLKIRVARANKYIVKKVAENWLPKEIVYREKVGFGTPVGLWFRNPHGLGRYLDILTDDTFRKRGFFNPESVEKVIREHLSGEKNHDEALWGLMNFELWCRHFIDDGQSLAKFDNIVIDKSKKLKMSQSIG